jgi:hypothetical protein
MLAHGTACSVGDQLHPNGLIDRDVYDLIGSGLQRSRTTRTVVYRCPSSD